jgi:hypothetical protein
MWRLIPMPIDDYEIIETVYLPINK